MITLAGKYLIILGSIAVIFGLIFYFLGDKLNWLGNLPGDIKIKKENFSFYFPIVTCIVLSLLLTIIMAIIRKIF
jgi:hypothetical protein